MSDIADQANDLAQEHLERILANRPAQSSIPSAVECVECGCDIPLARRMALPGVQLCISCKEDEDLKNKHYRR